MAYEPEAFLKTIKEDPFLAGMFACYEKMEKDCSHKAILDYGCGYGWGSWLLARSACQVTGYDPDRERICLARETFRRRNLSFTWDLNELTGKRFDRVCLFMVLPYVEQKEAVLEQAASYLAEGGTLWVSCKAQEKSYQILEKHWTDRLGLKQIDSDMWLLSGTEHVKLDVYGKG